MKKVLAIILTVVMLLGLSACMPGNNKYEEFNWTEILLGEMLPEPPSNKGDVWTNTADRLSMQIANFSETQYADYIEACREIGFTYDINSSGSSYEAFNVEGYKLYLSHYGSSKLVNITLDIPIEMSEITWPASDLGKQIPVPNSTLGKFNYENSDEFSVYIGNTSRDDYNSYVNTCIEKGFTVDYSKGDDHYWANNSNGWYVSLSYEGGNVMLVKGHTPKEDEVLTETTPVTTAPPETEPPATEKTETLGSDFKAAMDSYEEFMNKYVEFMKKFNKNPSDLSLLTDYANFMSDYAEYVESFEKWEDEDLNSAELAYYIDVQARVSKKLLEVVG
jgi:hypothetical protein